MMDVCRRGLAGRARCRCGGTASAVKFARLVMGGHDFTVEQLAVVAEAHLRLDTRAAMIDAADPAMIIEWQLWGGDAAASWVASAATAPRAGPEASGAILAAPGDARALQRLSATLARIDARLAADLQAMLEALIVNALTATGRVMANLVAGPRPSKQIAAAVGPVDRDHIAAALASCTDSTQVGLHIPAGVWAVLGDQEDAQLQRTLETLGPQAEARIEQAQDESNRAIAVALGLAVSAVATAAVLARQGEDRRTAVAVLVASALELARSRLRDPSPELISVATNAGRAVTLTVPRVPPQIVRSAIAVAGGAPPVPIIPRGAATAVGAVDDIADAAGRLIPTGTATSRQTVTMLDRLLARPEVSDGLGIPLGVKPTIVQTWVSTNQQFQPHTDLDGQTWTTPAERDEICAADPAEFPYVDVYSPNPAPDHAGCGCYVDSAIDLQ